MTLQAQLRGYLTFLRKSIGAVLRCQQVDIAKFTHQDLALFRRGLATLIGEPAVEVHIDDRAVDVYAVDSKNRLCMRSSGRVNVWREP